MTTRRHHYRRSERWPRSSTKATRWSGTHPRTRRAARSRRSSPRTPRSAARISTPQRTTRATSSRARRAAKKPPTNLTPSARFSRRIEAMANDDRQQIIEEFDDSVNMTRTELEEWLETDESKSVGQSDGGGESKGHESGRKIVEILGKNKSAYTDDDLEHMKRVNGYVKRHLGQGPKNDIEDSKWRYSLMNWGHDPLK